MREPPPTAARAVAPSVRVPDAEWGQKTFYSPQSTSAKVSVLGILTGFPEQDTDREPGTHAQVRESSGGRVRVRGSRRPTRGSGTRGTESGTGRPRRVAFTTRPLHRTAGGLAWTPVCSRFLESEQLSCLAWWCRSAGHTLGTHWPEPAPRTRSAGPAASDSFTFCNI